MSLFKTILKGVGILTGVYLVLDHYEGSDAVLGTLFKGGTAATKTLQGN